MAVFRAIESFAFTGHDGVPRSIRPGTLMSDDDPDYKGKESLFEPVEVAAARPAQQASGVEDATAQTDTKRSVARPRRRGA
jgi:hypothetical protein